jgi:hypothetical protein
MFGIPESSIGKTSAQLAEEEIAQFTGDETLAREEVENACTTKGYDAAEVLGTRLAGTLTTHQILQATERLEE